MLPSGCLHVTRLIELRGMEQNGRTSGKKCYSREHHFLASKFFSYSFSPWYTGCSTLGVPNFRMHLYASLRIKKCCISLRPFVNRYIAKNTLIFLDNVQHHLLDMYYVSYWAGVNGRRGADGGYYAKHKVCPWQWRHYNSIGSHCNTPKTRHSAHGSCWLAGWMCGGDLETWVHSQLTWSCTNKSLLHQHI
jgi:hypothetical protein